MNINTVILLLFLFILLIPNLLPLFGVYIYKCSSNSMKHVNKTTFYDFWETQGYTRKEVNKFPLRNGFEKGDIIIAVKGEDYKVGDVIVIGSTSLTHRILKINSSHFIETKDNLKKTTPKELIWISSDLIKGKVIAVIPYLKVFYN